VLTDLHILLTGRFTDKYATKSSLNMSLHYLVKCQYRKTSENLKDPLLSMTNHKIV